VIPNVEAVLYGIWGDVDAGETHGTLPLPVGADPNIFDSLPFVMRKPFWGLNGKPTLVNNPAQVIFLVAMMENDDGKPKAARGLVKGAAVAYPDPGLETAFTVLLQVWVPSVFSQKLGYLALIAQSR
jgi:hypothetical protein